MISYPEFSIGAVLPYVKGITAYFIDWPKNFGEWFAWEQAYCHFRDVTTQDMVNVEGMQKAYRSGSIDNMIVSDMEGGVRTFHDKVTQIVGEK